MKTTIMLTKFTATSGREARLTFVVHNGRLVVDVCWKGPEESPTDDAEVAAYVQSVLPQDSPAVEARRVQDSKKRDETFRELFGLARHDRN